MNKLFLLLATATISLNATQDAPESKETTIKNYAEIVNNLERVWPQHHAFHALLTRGFALKIFPFYNKSIQINDPIIIAKNCSIAPAKLMGAILATVEMHSSGLPVRYGSITSYRIITEDELKRAKDTLDKNSNKSHPSCELFNQFLRAFPKTSQESLDNVLEQYK